MTEPIVDAQVVEDEPQPQTGTALVAAPPAVGVVIRAERPEDIITKAAEIANPLKALIEAQGLSVHVGGKRKHVEVGGWQALGTMLGALGGQPLHAETVWTRPVAGDDGRPRRTSYHVVETRYPKGKGEGKPVEVHEYDVDGNDWEACVEVRTADGVVVGRAEAMCSRAELTWAGRPDQAVRSMAETRAESRAYRRAVGWIMSIAGYNPTPAEEMPAPPPATSPLGEPAEKDLSTRASHGLQALARGDIELAREVWGLIKQACDGSMPTAAALALAVAGDALTAAAEAPEIT